MQIAWPFSPPGRPPQKNAPRTCVHGVIRSRRNADRGFATHALRRTAESPEITNSLVQIQRTLRRLDQLVAGKENELSVSLDNLRALTENLRELSENAKRFPAQLFFGEPPKPSKTLP